MERRILVVEDSPTQAEHLKYLLEERGFTVTVAANGRQALAAARQQRPTIIISDIVMPEMDGYTLCKAIKADETLKDTPVVLVTALSSPQDVINGLQSGADNFIRKPYDEKYLLSRIEYILANRELRKSEKLQMGLEVYLSGEKHFITSERQQILDLLISIYEEGISLNEELKARQRDLERSYQSLGGLYRIAKGLNQATSEQEIIGKVLERTLELPGVQAGWIFLRVGESDFRTAGARGLPPALEAPGAMESDCLCRRQLLSGELHRAVNIEECERLQKAKGDTRGLRYHASIPLRVGDQPLGVMNLVGAEQGLFSDRDMEILNGIGNQIGVALDRVRLYEHLEKMVEERTAALMAEITARKQAEEALQRYATTLEERVQERTQELEAANQQLQEAMRLVEEASRHKSEFLANMSHELRTPLNSILGFSELLQEQTFGPLNEKQLRYVSNIHISGKHLLALINDILDLSKVEAGKLEFRPEAFALKEALEGSLTVVASQAAKKSLTLSLEVDERLTTLTADPARFKQILYNLLSNAVKFTPEGGSIRIDARLQTPASSQKVSSLGSGVFSLGSEGPFVEISVADTGIGIKAEDLPKLFQEFVQLEHPLSKQYEGTGLGLALTKKLVEGQGGRIWVESVVGRGSTFTFALPLRPQRVGIQGPELE